MYIAMNRFKINKGNEAEFETIWRERESRLKELPGFIEFHLLKCDTDKDESTSLYSSHAIWQEREDFINWTKSEQFRDAHKGAGERRHIFAGPPHFEGFEVVLSEKA